MSSFQGVRSAQAVQQESNRRNTMVKQQHNMWITTAMDEFKNGFPSDGLSIMRIQWWDSKDKDRDNEITAEEGKSGPEEKAKKKNGGDSIDAGDGKKVGLKGSDALVAIRKSIAEEGREKLKDGGLKGNGLRKIARKDRALLFRVFSSSLPKEWMNE